MLRFVRTGPSPTCIGDLERIHVNTCEFRVTVHGFVVQVVDQTDRIGRSPRCRCFPQSAMSQYFFNHFALWRFDERNYFHFATALRTDHGINFIHSLDQHGQVLLQRTGVTVEVPLGLDNSVDDAFASAFFRKPRLLLEYHPM